MVALTGSGGGRRLAAAAAVGGEFSVTSGAATSDVEGDGGAISFNTGDSCYGEEDCVSVVKGDQAGQGGDFTLLAGDGHASSFKDERDAGAQITMKAGDTTTTSGDGGEVTMTAGASESPHCIPEGVDEFGRERGTMRCEDIAASSAIASCSYIAAIRSPCRRHGCSTLAGSSFSLSGEHATTSRASCSTSGLGAVCESRRRARVCSRSAKAYQKLGWQGKPAIGQLLQEFAEELVE